MVDPTLANSRSAPNPARPWVVLGVAWILAVGLAPLSLWLALLVGLLACAWSSACLRKFGQRRVGLVLRWVAVGFYSLLLAEVALTGLRWVQSQAAGGRLPMGELWAEDSTLTSRLIPGRQVRHRWDGVFDVTMTIDPDGWRRAGTSAKSAPTWGCVGCSFTFGWGVNDDETLPAALQRRRHHESVENRAVPDHGTADALLILREYLEVSRARGRRVRGCIYLHIPEHFRRVALPLRSAAWDPNWPRRPRFELRGGTLEHIGKAGAARTVDENLALAVLRQSRLLEVLSPPWTPTDESLALSTALVAAMRDACVPAQAQFLVVLLPTREPREASLDRWKQQLLHANVRVVDAAARFHAAVPERDRADYFIPRDGHPRPRFHELMAQWLDEELRPSDD